MRNGKTEKSQEYASADAQTKMSSSPICCHSRRRNAQVPKDLRTGRMSPRVAMRGIVQRPERKCNWNLMFRRRRAVFAFGPIARARFGSPAAPPRCRRRFSGRNRRLFRSSRSESPRRWRRNRPIDAAASISCAQRLDHSIGGSDRQRNHQNQRGHSKEDERAFFRILDHADHAERALESKIKRQMDARVEEGV